MSKILIRIPQEQHQALKELAAKSRHSLNSLCVLALESLLARTPLVTPCKFGRPFADSIAVESIVDEFDADLQGIVLFGSWARGTASAHSDIDLLLVLRRGCALNRALYAQWDSFVSRAGISRCLSPHFCRLTASCRDAGSLWFEVALEGVVLWERELAVSSYLVRLRRFMFENDVRRRHSYGVPYWVRGDGKQKTRRGLPEASRTSVESS